MVAHRDRRKTKGLLRFNDSWELIARALRTTCEALRAKPAPPDMQKTGCCSPLPRFCIVAFARWSIRPSVRCSPRSSLRCSARLVGGGDMALVEAAPSWSSLAVLMLERAAVTSSFLWDFPTPTKAASRISSIGAPTKHIINHNSPPRWPHVHMYSCKIIFKETPQRGNNK